MGVTACLPNCTAVVAGAVCGRVSVGPCVHAGRVVGRAGLHPPVRQGDCCGPPRHVPAVRVQPVPRARLTVGRGGRGCVHTRVCGSAIKVDDRHVFRHSGRPHTTEPPLPQHTLIPPHRTPGAPKVGWTVSLMLLSTTTQSRLTAGPSHSRIQAWVEHHTVHGTAAHALAPKGAHSRVEGLRAQLSGQNSGALKAGSWRRRDLPRGCLAQQGVVARFVCSLRGIGSLTVTCRARQTSVTSVDHTAATEVLCTGGRRPVPSRGVSVSTPTSAHGKQRRRGHHGGTGARASHVTPGATRPRQRPAPDDHRDGTCLAVNHIHGRRHASAPQVEPSGPTGQRHLHR